jgi:hypothetical protein
MAINTKLSQIATAGSNPVAGDFIVGVTSSNTTDSRITFTQATSALSVFTNALQGVVPASGGGTTNFLRADGTWSPAGSVAAPTGSVQFNNSGVFGGFGLWDGFGVLSQGNATTAQTFRIYNTVDTISGPTNFERFALDWSLVSNKLTIGPQAGGSGVLRTVSPVGIWNWNGIFQVNSASTSVLIASGSSYSFDNGPAGTGGAEMGFFRDFTRLVALGSGFGPCDFNIYNITGGNPEKAILSWNSISNVFVIGPIAGGSGTVRQMKQTVAFSAPAPTTKTTAYSQTVSDEWLIFNGGASITLTLLSASSFPGQELWVRTIAAQPVISASSNVIPLVGGAAGTAILSGTAGKWALLVSDGTNWQIMAGN